MVEESCGEESQQYKDDSSPEEEEFIIQSVEIGQGLDEIVSESFAEDWNHGDESMVVSKETSDVDEETHTVQWKVIEDCEDAIRCKIINRIASTDETHCQRVYGVYQWTANLPTNGKYIKFKLDTGAEVNVLPKNLFDKLHLRPKLSRSAVKLSAYNNSDIPVEGKCIASVQHEGKVYKVLFMVVKSNTIPILGLNACQRLNLLQRVHMVVVDEDLSFKNEILNEFSDCFGEMGTLDTTYEIEMKDGIKPVVVPTCRVPFGLLDKLKVELDRMESLGVISKVEKSTDWVNGMVLVEKPNGNLHICLDSRPLNKAVKRHHYPIPTVEEITSKMEGATYFAKLDASSGYWQVKVDEGSADLLTFSTPFGRYRFNRMPFGIISASEIFQREVEKIIEKVNGAISAQDDIIIWVCTQQECKQRVKRVLSEIRKSGHKLNKSKCIFGASEVTFLGHVLSAEGVKSDPEKVKAIRDMEIPITKIELQRFLGMVNYLGKFLPNLAEETAPLRILLKKENMFVMDKPQIEATKHLKDLL